MLIFKVPYCIILLMEQFSRYKYRFQYQFGDDIIFDNLGMKFIRGIQPDCDLRAFRFYEYLIFQKNVLLNKGIPKRSSTLNDPRKIDI